MTEEECMAVNGEWKEVDGVMQCIVPEVSEETPASEPTEETPAQ